MNRQPGKTALDTLRWTILDTPDSVSSLTKELLNPNNQGAEINKMAVAPDKNIIWAIARRGDRNGLGQGGAQVVLYLSTDGGVSWSDIQYSNLDTEQSAKANCTFIWDIAIAPDDPNIIAVACADITVSPLTQEVWISTDKGNSWKNTRWPPKGVLRGANLISAVDISTHFGGHSMLIGTRDGTGLSSNNLQLMSLSDFGNWNTQDAQGMPPSVNPITGDILAAKFSPNSATDSTIVVIYVDGTNNHAGTWLATGIHNAVENTTSWQVKKAHVEIRNPDGNVGNSPRVNEIITANIELPCDFSGQNASCRRFYISTDASDRVANTTPNRGVYCIDDNAVYVLMDNTVTFGLVTSTMPVRRVSSIAYYGTCASGKLLVGSVLGYACQAAVPTWFTDSPTACTVPVWYPALKRPSGAAGQTPNLYTEHSLGYGNAQVIWSADGAIAYAATGSASLGPFAVPEVVDGAIMPAVAWPAGYANVVPFDESAFSISRNNGETWNQLSLINTLMAKLTDVAPSADGSTIYLASTNNNCGCAGFDSVWRSSSNPVVCSPLPALPIGSVWERIRVSPTNTSCNMLQSNYAVLRLSPKNSDGQIVFWAAGGSNGAVIGGYPTGPNTKAIAWSPDYGDYWDNIRSDITIQDLAVESGFAIYLVNAQGMIQKIMYTGTSWAGCKAEAYSKVGGTHVIAAEVEGKVLVGANKLWNQTYYPAAFSLDGAKTFSPITHKMQTKGNVHVAFGPEFDNDRSIYIADDATGGSICRCTIGTGDDWHELLDNDAANAAHRDGYYGLAVAYIEGTLYGAYGRAVPAYSAVECIQRSPSENMISTYLDSFDPQSERHPAFTLEPNSLKHCGGLTLDMPTMLFAIDNDFYAGNHNATTGFGGIATVRDRGMLWVYTDTPVKKEAVPMQTPVKRVIKQQQKITAEKTKEIKSAHQKEITFITEGDRDESILETAWQKLRGEQYCPFTIRRAKEAAAATGGAQAVATVLKGHIREGDRKVIGLFDRDSEGIKAFNSLPESFEPLSGYDGVKVAKYNFAFAMLLPVPPGREDYAKCENLSIEFMFPDEALEIRTAEGRTLELKTPEPDYFTTKNGKRIPLESRELNIPPEKLKSRRKIIDGKDVFAQEIVPNLDASYFQAFEKLFQMIEEIVNSQSMDTTVEN